jgi:uncharacterized protein
MHVGSLSGIYRYPVKSMAGEQLTTSEIGQGGLPGDRAWAVRDEVRGGIRGAKKIPALMQLSARYLVQPGAGCSTSAEITLPGGVRVNTGDVGINALLSAALNHKVSLWPLVSPSLLDHYRRGAPDNEDLEQELRDMFARTPDEPLPDLSVFPPELMEFESPPGTYFDAFPILLMSQQSLATLQSRQENSRFDVRRFRPNLLVDVSEGGNDFPEQVWAGKRLQIGSVILRAEMACPRCAMTTHGFDDLPKDPTIMRALVRENGGNLGLYASIEQPGTVQSGDRVTVLE